MRRVRYSVAMSLDGYIAGPKGEYDWIPMDPDIDFAALAQKQGGGGGVSPVTLAVKPNRL